MHTISKELLRSYQTRLRKRQKEAFIRWLTPQLKALGYGVHIEKSHTLLTTRNIVVGDIATADYVFGAHYDTQAVSPVPVVMPPKSLLFFILSQLPVVVLGLAMTVGVSVVFALLTGYVLMAGVGALAGYILFMFVFFAGVANPHTANDNTSGVVTLVEIMANLPKALRNKAAFVLFDNEEYGLLGSQAFYSKHKKIMRHKMLVNFDCVSNGDSIHIAFSKKAKKQAGVAERFSRAFRATENKAVTVETGLFIYTSDQMSFPVSAAVCALKPSKIMGPYLGRIHTKRDTVFDEANITLLRDGAIALLSEKT